MLTIGKLAQATGVTPDTLRYYEREGLLVVPAKSEAGYRHYGPGAQQRVLFIKQAQGCGFTLAEIGELLALQASDAACCGDIRQKALEKKLQLEAYLQSVVPQFHYRVEKRLCNRLNEYSSFVLW